MSIKSVLLQSARIVLIPTLILGCSTTHYRKTADRDAYQAISEKSPDVPGMSKEFSIETEETWQPLADLPVVTEEDPALGSEQRELGASIVPLEQALQIAVRKNRTYQTRKESLYLQALALMLERHQYSPIFSGGASSRVSHSLADTMQASDFSTGLSGTRQVIGQIESMTGTPADVLGAYADLVEGAGALAGLDEMQTHTEKVRTLSGETQVGMDWLLEGGGRIAVGLTSNFMRFLTGEGADSASSALVGTFTQPLLKGAGAKVAAEQLTQAERDLLYELRRFTRYRKEFTVEICSSYYSVLRTRDVVRNNWRSYKNFVRNVERERALAQEGRSKQADLGRLEQALLNNENNWINAVRRYKNELDNFKIQLGLSMDANLVLDDTELSSLRKQGLQHPKLSDEDAIKVALATRLDLYTQYDQLEDAERKVYVAADALKPGLSLLLRGEVDNSGQRDFENLDFERATWSAGVDLDLPLDRTSERNAYRSTLIRLEQAKRETTLKEDSVKLDVRAAWRNLDQAYRNYEIAKMKVDLSARRVEEQELRAELGEATAMDQVDAQNDFTQSQNELIESLVNHTLYRLAFWRDIGILYIKENGQWEEVKDAF